MEYQYPFSMDWSSDEVIEVIQFFQIVEKAYEMGINRDELMQSYRKFKMIVPSIAEEKKYGREFEEASGYSLYKTIQKAKSSQSNELIRMRSE
ncbi:UPF0223 family protein [Bacillus niameyensis]|uniref:UPF0223 family protein n=1 Tax=Bacillus niameyensis TaxID=1522308 RepID=UPI000781C207|nr:UPF0223 family protein [Bacillus niameyensis]